MPHKQRPPNTYDWGLFSNRDMRDKYALELRNRFEEKTEKSTPNDEYENFINAHLEAAVNCIPTKPRTKYSVPWETLAVSRKTGRRENCLQMLQEEPNKHKCPKTKKGTKWISQHISQGTDRIHTKSDR